MTTSAETDVVDPTDPTGGVPTDPTTDPGTGTGTHPDNGGMPTGHVDPGLPSGVGETPTGQVDGGFQPHNGGMPTAHVGQAEQVG
jgi:hypothetical protein